MKALAAKSWVGWWALYSIFLIFLSEFSGFRLLGVPIMNPSFADLRFITSASDCYSSGAWSMTSVSCDPWERPFNYPSLWVKFFSYLGLGESKTIFLGILELLILSAALIYWIHWAYLRLDYYSSRKMFAIFALCTLLSPPILLLAERGNIDILIFAGMTLAHFNLTRSAYLTAGLLVSLLGTLKLYPFLALLKILDFRKRVVASCLILASSFLGIFIIFDELEYVLSRSANGWNSISFGLSELPLLLLGEMFGPNTKLVAAAVGAIILVFTALVISILKSKKAIAFESLNDSNSIPCGNASTMSLLFLGSYLSGTAYDYRLITLVPVIFLLLVNIRSKTGFWLIIFLSLASLYFGHLTLYFGKLGLLFNAFGDVSISLFASFLLSVYLDRLRKTVAMRKRSNVQIW